MQWRLALNNNPRFEKGPMKVKFMTHAFTYIFANMILVKAIQDFFNTGEEPEDKIDLSYYREQATLKALEYINAGADYMETVQEEQTYVHKGIDLDIRLIAPIVVIPEDIKEFDNKKTLVLNMGTLDIKSNLIRYEEDVDYTKVNRPEELYDKYNITLTNFQLSMIENLTDYKKWEDTRKIDIIKKITIKVNASRTVEPEHPEFPNIELVTIIEQIDIYFSDYILANILKI
jgi:hypothetical protein